MPAAPPAATENVILLIEHALGGGVQKHVQTLTELFSNRARFMVLSPMPGGLLRISQNIPSLPSHLYFDAKRELAALRQFLSTCGITRIHYHHLIQLPWEIARLPLDLNIPYDYTAHDYFSFCPQIALISEDFRYCGEPAEAGCNRCLASRPTPGRESIEAWRSRYRTFIEGASRVFAPSPGVVERLKKHFPNAKLVLAPHPESGNNRVQDPQWRYGRQGSLKIVVLGALNPTKGPDLLEACALDARVRGLALEFHLLGSAYRDLKVRPESELVIHGPYRDEDLDRLIEALSPHLAWFPAQWPETYSYTLSTAVRHGLPIAAPDFGAFRDRLSGRPLSWLLPWDTEAPIWNDVFARLGENVFAAERYLMPATAQPAIFSYESDYLVTYDRARSESPAVDLDLRAYRRPWRLNKEFVSGYLMSSVHRALRQFYALPGVRRVAISLFPEYRIQLFRRWLGRY